MVFGMFMAIMDIQIVTSSLAQIQGGLSASADEIGWVQTSYLIAEVVMIPLSGILSRLLSTRVLFVVSALGFTVVSAMCATATSLSQMIVYRALQGFIGGAMMPIVFPVVYTSFPARQLAPLMVLISLILNLSSTLGPTIGGYLTDTSPGTGCSWSTSCPAPPSPPPSGCRSISTGPTSRCCATSTLPGWC